jgi:hypothetical protein
MLIVARRFTGLASASFILASLAIPVFAQTETIASVMMRERTSASAAREYAPAVWWEAGSVTIPASFIVPSSFRSLVEVMLRDSPTFRRQCQRIANASMLSVRLERAMGPLASDTRARTRITRDRSGTLVAVIEVPPLDDDVELIAHEIEHVVEQLDNIDLASKAARPGTGVHFLAKGPVAFETTRAVTIGRRVAEEVRRGGR